MNRYWVVLAFLFFGCGAYGEQILKMPNGEKYLGAATSDQSGIFVDCGNVPHKVADGELQVTSERCAPPEGIYAWSPVLITISPLEVVSVDPKKKEIKVLEGAAVKYLDMQKIPSARFEEFTKGTQVAVVVDKKSSKGGAIVTEAIFGNQFAIDAKTMQDEKAAHGVPHSDGLRVE